MRAERLITVVVPCKHSGIIIHVLHITLALWATTGTRLTNTPLKSKPYNIPVPGMPHGRVECF